MHKNTTGCMILLALLVLFCSAGTASAMSAFSRKYKMQCDGCHTSQIPQLNEFGIEFYKNGFALSKQEDGTKAGTGQGSAGTPDAAGGKEKAGVKPGAATAAKPSAGKDDEGDDEEEEPPPKKEVPPTVVYRSKTHDGTPIFTDTPERRKELYWKQDNGEEIPAEPKPVSPLQPKKRKKGATRQPAERPDGGGTSVKIVETKRFRNYEECMEYQLVGAKRPESGQEMMELMMAAERKCAAYPQGKR